MPTITATVEQAKRGWRYRVYEDGVERKSSGRTSQRAYSHIHVQRWTHDAEAWAARYTSSPKAIGSKLEYGYVAEVIPIRSVEPKSFPGTTHKAVDPAGLTCTVGPSAVTGKRCGKPAVQAFTASTGEVFAECAEHRC